MSVSRRLNRLETMVSKIAGQGEQFEVLTFPKGKTKEAALCYSKPSKTAVKVYIDEEYLSPLGYKTKT